MKKSELNSFHQEHGANIFKLPVPFILMLLTIAVVGSLVGSGGTVTGFTFIALPFILTYVFFVFKNPRLGLIGVLIANYIILGFSRYIKGLPLGMSIDFQLILIYVALFFKSFFQEVPWKRAKNDLLTLSVIWFIWVVFQLLNPIALSRVAWFYSMRSIGLYLILTIPLIFIIFNTRKDLRLFLHLWGFLALFGAIKGILQKHIGLDPFEHEWLMGPAKDTHLLFGQLRVFSIFTDAGQFGGTMGHSGVVFSILALNQKKSKKLKYFYLTVGILSLYGLIISGTRGAIAIPIMGFGLYILLQKNLKIIIIGGLLGLSVLVFFKYTTIGNGNYAINRMRTAFNPEDKSLQVRIENQRRLKTYMASRPIGNGIGSTGRVAARQAPNSPISQIPTDSWYVLIWVEHGIVGLTLHLLFLFYIVIKSSYIIAFKLRDPWVKAQLSALVSGMFGIMVASYGNAIFGQMPTVIILYSTMGFLFLAIQYDEEAIKMNKINLQLQKKQDE